MNFRELVEGDMSKEFEKASGLTKDSKKIGKGNVYFLTDGSSIVIGNEKGRIQHYDSDMNFITSYTRVPQAIKALSQAGILTEAKKLPTVSMVKKALKSLDFEFILPEFFSVEKKNTDAGMGGYNYIQIIFDKDFITGSSKKSMMRANDVNLAIKALSSKFDLNAEKATNGVLIIR